MVNLHGGLKGALEGRNSDCVRITSESGSLEASLILTREDLFRLLYIVELQDAVALARDINHEKDRHSELQERAEELESEIEEMEEALREKKEEMKENENEQDNLKSEIDDLESDFQDCLPSLRTFFFRAHLDEKKDGVQSPETLAKETVEE